MPRAASSGWRTSRFGRAAGLTEADLDAVLGGQASDTLSAGETAVLDLVSALRCTAMPTTASGRMRWRRSGW